MTLSPSVVLLVWEVIIALRLKSVHRTLIACCFLYLVNRLEIMRFSSLESSPRLSLILALSASTAKGMT